MNKPHKNHLTFEKRIILFFLLPVIVLMAGCLDPAVLEKPLVRETPKPKPTATAAVNNTPVNSTTENTPTLQPSPTIMAQPGDLAGVAIRFVHPWSGQVGDTIAEIARQFSLSNPWDIWVDAEGFGSESELIAALQSDSEFGETPNLLAIHPYQLENFAEELFSIRLNDYFNDPEWGFDAEAQTDLNEVFLEQFNLDGNLIALPVAPQATVLFYNQTWAETLGHPSPPMTPEDFREQSCAGTFANLADNDLDNDGMGGYPRNFDPEVLASWYRAFGGEIPQQGQIAFNNESGQRAFGFLKSTDLEGCIWVSSKPDPYEYFADRNALMYAGTLDQIPLQTGWMAAKKNDDIWSAIGFPGLEGEVMLVDGPGLMIVADTPEKQMAAWLFAMHLLEPEIQEKLVQRMNTLPVRKSTLGLLQDFAEEYPQWAQAAALVDRADVLPISHEWGIAQWVLQDAVYRILQSEADQTESILAELDRMLGDLDGVVP